MVLKIGYALGLVMVLSSCTSNLETPRYYDGPKRGLGEVAALVQLWPQRAMPVQIDHYSHDSQGSVWHVLPGKHSITIRFRERPGIFGDDREVVLNPVFEAGKTYRLYQMALKRDSTGGIVDTLRRSLGVLGGPLTGVRGDYLFLAYREVKKEFSRDDTAGYLPDKECIKLHPNRTEISTRETVRGGGVPSGCTTYGNVDWDKGYRLYSAFGD